MRLSTAQLDAGLPFVTTWTMVILIDQFYFYFYRQKKYCVLDIHNLNYFVTVSRGQEMKFDMGLCSNACARFCNDGEVIQSVEA